MSDSKRPRVYGPPRAHVLPHAGVVPVHTRRFESTHGARLERTHEEEAGKEGEGGGHRQFCSPKFAVIGLSRAPENHRKKPLDLTHFQFENRSKTTQFPSTPIPSLKMGI